jgi:hypothetical protein
LSQSASPVDARIVASFLRVGFVSPILAWFILS